MGRCRLLNNKNRKSRKRAAAICLCSLSLLLCGCAASERPEAGPGSDKNASDLADAVADAAAKQASPENSPGNPNDSDATAMPVQPARGTKQPIPEQIRQEMAGVSMPEGAAVAYDDLSYLTIPHYDYSGAVTEGHMIVDAELADEVLDIFEELFLIRFQIEKMEIIDRFQPYINETFDNLDRASMSQNNTSAFCYRVVNGTSTLSYHARGRAIDINPKINPYCIPETGYVSPANAYAYADRSQDWPGIIRRDDAVYHAFVSRGWEWGGDWASEKDYQHFQKP